RAETLFRDIRALRNDKPLILQDGQELTFLRPGALEVVKRFESDAKVLLIAHAVLRSWGRRDISADIEENPSGGLATGVGGETDLGKKGLPQASEVLETLSARLLRHAHLLRTEWGAPRYGGRPRKDAVLLKPVAAILKDQKPHIQRRWIERLAPELLGR